jgi:nicotinate-nucleotide pyrophosphorylase (carboxylating)
MPAGAMPAEMPMYETNETLAEALARNVRDALMEDIGRGDWTARLVPAGQACGRGGQAKQEAVLCGQPWFDACVLALDPAAQLRLGPGRGPAHASGQVVCHIHAAGRALLSAERPALNFLQMLSAVAT